MSESTFKIIKTYKIDVAEVLDAVKEIEAQVAFSGVMDYDDETADWSDATEEQLAALQSLAESAAYYLNQFAEAIGEGLPESAKPIRPATATGASA